MKKILIGSVVVVGVVAVAGAVVVNYLLDGETIAQELQKEAKTRFNRDLKFAGPVDIKLFPKIAIELPATTLSFANSDKSQLTLNSASIGVAVLPLLKGEVKLDAVKINGLKGVLNVERLKAAVDAKQKAESAKPSVATTQKNESSSFIKDLSVDSVDVFDSALTLYGLQDKKVYQLSQVNLATGSLAMKGETVVRFAADFAEKTQGLRGHASLDSHVLYDVKTLDVSLEKVTAALQLQQKEAVSTLTLSTPKVAYKLGDVFAQDVQVHVTAPNETDVRATAEIASGNSMTIWNVDLLKGEAKTKVGECLLTVPFDGKVSAQTNTEIVALALNAQLEKSPLTVKLNSVGFSKPGVTGSINLDRFVADPWLGKEVKQVASSQWNVIGNAWAAPTTDLSALTMADANLDVKVGEVQYQGLNVEQLTGNLLLQKGKLTLGNWRASVCDGSVNANMTLNQNAVWSVNAQTSKVNTQCLARSFDIQPMLEGVATATVKVNGTGLEPIAIKKTMAGNLSASVNNATLRGLSLEKLATSVRDKNVVGLVVQKTDTTPLQALSMKATVKNGELCVTNLSGKSSVAEVSGKVNVNLLTEALGGTVKAKLATSVDGRRVTVPINLGGTVSEPTYQFDVGEALKSQLKEELKNPDLLLKGLNQLLKR